MIVEMEQYGYRQEQILNNENIYIGRVISQEKAMYRVVSRQGELYAVISGKMKYEAVSNLDYPAVGDFVKIDRETDRYGGGIISGIIPRKSILIRRAAGTSNKEQVVASNIDTLFLCMSLNQDFNLRRLERYLAVAWESGATPVVVLTKSDLCDDLEEKLYDVESVAMGVDILVTSALELDGLEQIEKYIKPGKTVALIGSSGVGKSTLINRLIGDNILETDGLRNDDKGHHTTTRRELILLENGGIVIDTPGMRELGMWDAESGIVQTFSDIEDLKLQCRYSDCTHNSEPGCAIQKAIELGELSMDRWSSYQKLLLETSYSENKESYLEQKEKKFKDIAKINKKNKKR